MSLVTSAATRSLKRRITLLGSGRVGCGTVRGVGFLTKQQQLVLCAIILLLLTGQAVKSWRLAHPPMESKSGWVQK